MKALVANWREWQPIHRPTHSLTEPGAYCPSISSPYRTCPGQFHRTIMDVDNDHHSSSSVTLPAISVQPSPSKRAPPPLKLKENATLPSFGDLFDGVNVSTPCTPFTRLARNFERGSPLRSPLRSPPGLAVPSFAIQPATPVAPESTAGTEAATYVPTEQLVNNDFEIDPALADATTSLNTSPFAPLGLPITSSKDMLYRRRHEKTSSERNVLRDTSPVRSYSAQSPGTSPYRHMHNRWDAHSISPAQISRSPSPCLLRDDSDEEPAGYMEMDASPVKGPMWQQPAQPGQNSFSLPQDGYFGSHSHQTAEFSSIAGPSGSLRPDSNCYPTPVLTPAWSRVTTPLPVPMPSTPPGYIRTSPAAHAYSAPAVPCYPHPTPYASPGAEFATSLDSTVPPGAAFERWNGHPASAYYDNLQVGSWSEGSYRPATPAYSEMSMDMSPSPASPPLPYMHAEYRHSFTRSPSPSPASCIAMGSGPVRPGMVHGRSRHSPVARKRSTTGVQLNQFSQLTVDLVYPNYDGAMRQWSPIIIDQHNPVPHDYRDKRGFWDDNCFWTWDCTVKVHTRCIRICAQCHTARPGAKTWRRSHIQLETSLCNKCGIYEHTHQQPRPPKPGDAEKAYNPAMRLETFNYMITSRSRAPKKDGTPSPPLKFKPNPVFGDVQRKEDDAKPATSHRTRKDRGSDDGEYRPGR
ncbi:hypothetical protein CspeluHIS016_0109090 [Cutaneotrichosporon spelunceum]|uniref:GATA-type domain-containing protein n=1 Tax=Cutaneotrichosporon spelunceum TaxID=1672016 RepID=A0AAD3Y9T6_9TREE|nr:hypothetical protein CspeluHIS016_0109090 [Cutaneotrichosporon spelunceum]